MQRTSIDGASNKANLLRARRTNTTRREWTQRVGTQRLRSVRERLQWRRFSGSGRGSERSRLTRVRQLEQLVRVGEEELIRAFMFQSMFRFWIMRLSLSSRLSRHQNRLLRHVWGKASFLS